MTRKIMIELAREIVGGVEGERERKEKDRETAEVINPMEMEEQEVEESIERKALVQLSRLLEKADLKIRKEERSKEKAAEGKGKRRVSKEEQLRAEAAKSSKKITSFFDMDKLNNNQLKCQEVT